MHRQNRKVEHVLGFIIFVIWLQHGCSPTLKQRRPEWEDAHINTFLNAVRCTCAAATMLSWKIGHNPVSIQWTYSHNQDLWRPSGLQEAILAASWASWARFLEPLG